MPTRYLQDGLAVRLVKRKPVRKTNQKRLEEFVKGIKGFIDEDAARAILNKRKPAPEIRKVVPGLAGWRKAEEKYRREGKEWRSIRKDVETMHKKRKWLEKIAKEEAKKVFSAKPYDPHKTERGRGTYKNYE